MNKSILGIAAAATTFAALGTTAALTLAPTTADAETRELRQADVMLVKIHADWCGHCARLTPHWDQAQSDRLGEQDVLFVKLDITNPQRKAHSEMLANELGLGDIWEARSGRTGQMFIVDRNSKEIVANFNSSTGGSDIAKALDKALKS